jgi:hypothetical protein
MVSLSTHTELSLSALTSGVKEFAIVPLHAAPAEAVAEIDALYDVYLDVRQKWGLEVRLLWGVGSGGPLFLGQQATVS